jgi:glutamyl/glutaminyl-tRNA synthetase
VRLTRFAPAPTGYLHLGHIVNAIYVWGMARARGARVLLRVEDHDRDRSRPEYERALLDDLDWLGFTPDLFSTDDFRAGRCESRQSDRGAIYADAARQLADAGLLYACACTRRDIARASTDTTDELKYPGTCRDLGLPLDAGVTWRVRMTPGVEGFDDALLGPQAQDPAEQCGDVAIRDRSGHWTYQFAVTVDDHLQGITLVVRGRDLLASTGRQIRLGRLLGRAEPATYAHHPLVMKSPTQKLSKSGRDSGVRDLRQAGWSPARVIALAAAQAGVPSDLLAAST